MASVQGAADAWGEEIRFHVVDGGTGKPIQGALVHASVDGDHVREAHTDAAGIAGIAKAKTYAVYADRKVGYGVHWQRGAAAEEEVALEPLDPLPGRVVDALGRPIVGATVVALDDFDQWWNADLPLLTDTEGRFTVAGVRWREATGLAVTARGYAERIVRPLGSSRDEVVVELAEGAAVRGVVVDEADRPVAGARVTALDIAETETDADGRYRIEGFAAPMEVRLHARGPQGRVGATAPFALRSPETRREVGIRIRRVGSLEVVAVDAARGEVVTPEGLGLQIEAEGDSTGSPPERDFEAGEGAARFEDLAPGRYTLRVVPTFHGNHGPFLVPTPQAVVVRGGATSRVSFRLDRGMEVRGRVRGPRGEDRDARVVFQSNWKGVPQECRADAQGSFRLAGVPPGPGTLILRSVWGSVQWASVDAARDLGDFVLPRGGIVEGHLPGLPPGAVLAATIVGGPMYANEGRDVHTDVGGRFRIEDLPTNRPFDLGLERRGGGERVWTDLVLAPEEVLDLGEVSWRTRKRAAGTVLDPDGSPIVAAKVTFYSHGHGAPSAHTDRQGRFRIDTPPLPCAGIRVDVGGLPSGFFPPPAGSNDASLALRLPLPGRLRTRFVRQGGEPMSGATFRLAWIPPTGTRPSGGILEPLSTCIAADGDGWIDVLLPPGNWRLEVWGGLGGEIVGGSPNVNVEAQACTSLLFEVR